MQIEPKRTYEVSDLDLATAYASLAPALLRPDRSAGSELEARLAQRTLRRIRFFNIVAAYPPTFVVAPALGARKDTLANLLETKEFTVNIVTEETAEAMNLSAGSYAADVNEFEQCGLTEVAAETIDAPLVGEAVANFECRVTHTIPVGMAQGEQPGTGMLVVGEANKIYIAERLVDDNFNVDQPALRAVGRHAGGFYSTTASTLFYLERPE